MGSQHTESITSRLASRVEQGAVAAQLADVVVSTWSAASAALTPVLGQRGVAALYWRCLHLVGPQHPWLAALHDRSPSQPDIEALRDALVRQSTAHAAAGGAALLQTLDDLLGSLVGPALTNQLLQHVWNHLSGGPPAQDIHQ